ncbi:MAG: hypothetical protein H0X38_07065 [Planctomycetes bacterium]|nr:hypothetical protein [Planctomycetota bacterium]
MPSALSIAVVATLLATAFQASSAENPLPVAKFQGDVFNEMARAFGCVVSTDAVAHTLTLALEKDGSVVTVPIRMDTELHVRDSWGELGDFFAGQRVMLFMYVDDERKWTWPRAVQDELHMTARHGYFDKVVAIEAEGHSYTTAHETKNPDGTKGKDLFKRYHYDPAVKVWKGATATGIESLAVGDEVIQQQVLKDGVKVTVEIADRNGDKEIAALQDAKHHQDEDHLGLPCYVTDVDVLTGAVSFTVPWCSAARAKQLAPGAVTAVVPGDGSKAFAAALIALQEVDQRERLQMVVNSRVASRLAYGQALRLFVPGTGPAVPTGKVGVPESGK